ncbi:MAG: hypothetical protein RMI34_03915 [Chloroherpetonaceae bacterium]|nr:hypothetical protein [Chloroherpetonaceae bacterium]
MQPLRATAAFAVLLGCLLGGAPTLWAQPEAYSHPELRWLTIETEHFAIHYHEGAERSAKVAAKIAEEIYKPITSLYQHDPGKVHIIIKDTDDYSNGGAYFFENKIEIWAPALEFNLRGQHNWLRNVITHEYTHIVSLTAAQKFGQQVPAIYLQVFGYEQVRRPDILYGFPNLVVSYPIAGINVPFWLAEGVAQYQRPELRYDTWDTHRDMILRTLTLEHKLLDFDQLSNFSSKRSIDFEFTYNSGFALARFLAMRYGEEKLAALCKNFASLGTLNMHAAVEQTFGKPSSEIYQEWRTYLERDYQARIAPVLAHQVEGKIIESRGYANLYPVFSPDGSRLYYISNLGADFGGHSVLTRRLYGDSLCSEAMPTVRKLTQLYAAGEREPRFSQCKVCARPFHPTSLDVLQSGVSSRLVLTKDERFLLYSRYTGTNFRIQKYNDLFVYDLHTRQERRLTYQARLEMPALSPDETRFVAVHQRDGTQNLVEGNFIPDADGDSVKLAIRPLTHFSNGEQVQSPLYLPDGKHLVFALGVKNSRRLMLLELATGALMPLTDSIDVPEDLDERDAALSPDGTFLYFASNRTGIFNIYRMHLSTHKVEQMTNVVGGAFMPAVNQFGDLVYSLFTADGYKIALIKQAEPIAYPNAQYVRVPTPIPAASTLQEHSEAETVEQALASLVSATMQGSQALSSQRAVAAQLSDYDDRKVPDFKPTEYSTTFGTLSILPLLRFDGYARTQGSFLRDVWRATKLGVAFGSSELLGRLSFFGSLAMAPGSGVSGGASGLAGLLELERDALLSFEYTDQNVLPPAFLPRLSLDIYHQTRNVQDGAQIKIGIDSATANVFYTLTQFDLSLRFRLPIEHWLFQASQFRLTFSFSPYSSKVGAFFWQPLGQTLPASSETYFIGRTLTFVWNTDLRARTTHAAINPIGFFSRIRLDYEHSSLQDSLVFSESAGRLIPQYQTFSFLRLTTDFNVYLPLPAFNPNFRHTLSLRAYAALNFTGRETNIFFHNFISGLLGMRGYEYFAIGGDKAAFLHIEYRFPLLERINWQVAQFYFDKLYLSTFFDIGTAWSQGGVPALSAWRRDIGFELRLEAPSFYIFPTRLFASATYGLDRFSQPLRQGFFTADGSNFVTYGGQWMFHFGVLFEFDFVSDRSPARLCPMP